MKRIGQIACLWVCLLVAQPAYAQQIFARVNSWIDSVPRKVLQQVNQYLNGQLEVGSVNFRFPSSLTLHDIQLKDAAGDILASANKINMQLTLSALVKGRLVIDNMQLFQPTFYLSHIRGKLNWASLLRTQESFDKNRNYFIRIDNIFVQNGRFFFENPKHKVEILCENITAESSVKISGKNTVISASSIHSERGTINAKKLQFPYQNLQADSLSFKNKILHIQKATSSITGLHARAQGGIDFHTKQYNIHAWLDAPQETWIAGLAPLPFALPAFQATATLTGKLKQPIVQARAELSECKPYNIAVQKGWLAAHITRQQVRIEDGLLQLEGGGSIAPQGWVRYADKAALFQSQLTHVRVANIAQAGQHGIALDGFMNGNLRVTGLVDSQKPLHFTFQGEGKKLQLLGRSLAAQTQVQLDVDLLSNNNLKIHQILLNSPGLNSRIVGILRNQGSSWLAVSGNAKKLRLLPQELPDLVSGKNIQFRFRISMRGKRFHVSKGQARLGQFNLGQYRFNKILLTFQQVKSSQRLQIQLQQGQIATGKIKGEIALQQISATAAMTGNIAITGMALPQLQQLLPNWAEPTTGTLDAQLVLSGSFTHPHVSFQLQGQKITLHQLPIGTLNCLGEIDPDAVYVSQLTTHHPSVTTSLRQFKMLWSTRQLTGSARVHVIKLGSFVSALQPQWEGHLYITADLGGTLSSPRLTARTKVENLYWQQIPLGSGLINVKLHDSSLQYSTQTLLQLSGQLKRGDQNIMLRSSFFLPNKKFRLQFSADHVGIKPWSRLLPHITDVSGKLRLNLSAQGDWNTPEVIADMHIPQLKLQPVATSVQDESSAWQSVGSLHSRLSLTSGRLRGFLCALRQDPHTTNPDSCLATDPVQMQFRGTVSRSGAASIKTTGRLVDLSVQQFVKRWQSQFTNITTSLDFKLAAARSHRDAQWTRNGYIDLSQLQITATGSPSMQLQQPVRLLIDKNRFQLNSPTQLIWADQKTWLQGWVDYQRLDIQIKGAVPLPLISYLLPNEASVSGSLIAKLRIWGPWVSPLWQGCLSTNSQLLARISAVQDTIRWHKGEFLLQPSQSHPGCTNIQAQQISLTIGTGGIELEGATDFCPLQHRTHNWNAHAQIKDLFVKQGRSWLELNGNVSMITKNDINHATGDLNIATGLLDRRFSWQDFILTAQNPQTTGQPLSLNWLEPLQTNVHILAPNLPLLVDIAVARARCMVSSDLQLKKQTGKELFLTGGVEVLEGTIQFPAIDFAIQQETILLKRSPGAFAHANIDLHASSTELPQDSSSGTPAFLKLRLTGDWNKMRASLQSFPQNSKWDSSSLLTFLVSPTGSSSLGALLALSTQVAFQPAVGEFEDWFFDTTQSRLRVSSTTQTTGSGPRLQWELDEHIELEAAASLGASSNSINNLRLRILLFDHLPVGNSLFLEGAALVPYERQNSTRFDQQLRLVYRILEQ
ncbi:MAG: translocation/assembly module TamB domain-containing protein [Myxococcota bacterium]